jgi:hypothetical protein
MLGLESSRELCNNFSYVGCSRVVLTTGFSAQKEVLANVASSSDPANLALGCSETEDVTELDSGNTSTSFSQVGFFVS